VRRLNPAAASWALAAAVATVFSSSRAEAAWVCDGQPACPSTIGAITLAATPMGSTVVKDFSLYASDTGTCYYVGTIWNYSVGVSSPGGSYYTTTPRAPCPCVVSCTQACIDLAYWRIDAHWQEKYDVLGEPVDDQWWPSRDCGGVRYFQGGTVYYSPLTGPWEVHGLIGQSYQSMGEEFSWLGYPTTDEIPSGDGFGGVYNAFEHGYIFFNYSYGAWPARAWLDGRTLFDMDVPTGYAGDAWTMYQYAGDATNRGAVDAVRGKVLQVGLNEVVQGWSGQAAIDRYQGGPGGWCSEWASFVYRNSFVNMGDNGIWIFHEDLGSCATLDEFKSVFGDNGKLPKVDAWNLEPGDWLPLSNHHSTVVVAASPDRRYVWIMEGNYDNRVNFRRIDYVKEDGTLNSEFDVVGKIR
jgi:hypothetical protein